MMLFFIILSQANRRATTRKPKLHYVKIAQYKTQIKLDVPPQRRESVVAAQGMVRLQPFQAHMAQYQ